MIAGSVPAQKVAPKEIRTCPFDVLRVQDNVNVVYRAHKDSTGLIRYSGKPEFDDAFILSCGGGTLKIQVNTEDVGNPELPTIYVYSHDLAKVENYSDFNVTVENPRVNKDFLASLVGNGTIDVKGLDTAKVSAKVTAGNGTITLHGKADEANFRMLGTGAIRAFGLDSRQVVCKILGGGMIECDPEMHLKVRGIGSTKIYYKGDPGISHSGGGKVIQAE